MINNRKQKQLVVKMQDHYPFGQCQQINSENTKVLVRKIYRLSTNERLKFLQKISYLKKLKLPQMIKLESILQEEDSIHCMYEYIPIKLQVWISNINDQFIQTFRDQLIKFSSSLANNHIKTQFQLKNIGMDQNYGAKYFLDANYYQIDQNINRQKLKSTYVREITNLFKPYLSHEQIIQNQKQQIRNKQSDKKIEPDKNTNNIKTSKQNINKLNNYYQEVNMSVDFQNQKILQQFLDVLQNDEEDVNPPPTPTAPPSKPNAAYNQQHHSQNQAYHHPSQNVKTQSLNYQQIQNNYIDKKPANQTQNNNNAPQIHYQNPILNQQYNNINSNQSKATVSQHVQNENLKQTSQLQQRVKSAIQKSLNAIKKFKAIKEGGVS